jgi:hypothetical protein
MNGDHGGPPAVLFWPGRASGNRESRDARGQLDIYPDNIDINNHPGINQKIGFMLGLP